MHGQISGGGIGFCHRNYGGIRQRVAVGPSASTGEERGEAVGGQLPWGDNEACTRGALKAVLQVPASSLGSGYLSSGTRAPTLLYWTWATVGPLSSSRPTMGQHGPLGPAGGPLVKHPAPSAPLPGPAAAQE